MRLLSAFLICALLSACSTNPPISFSPQPAIPTSVPSPPEQKILLPPETSPTPLVKKEPPQTILRSQLHHLTSDGINLHLFVCDDRNVRFSIADKSSGPDSAWPQAKSAASSHNAIAAINGGFFSPEGKPLGLVIESGKKFGHWNASSSLTSGIFSVYGGEPVIARTKNSKRTQAADHLLQTGPFLIENGSPVTGLSNSRTRPRSFLLWDGKHHWAFGYASNATLSSLAKSLAKQPIPGIKIKTALNLDGGSSSQLWVANSVKGGPGFHRPFLRKPVRNFILAHESP